jgi:hypothetical protein
MPRKVKKPASGSVYGAACKVAREGERRNRREVRRAKVEAFLVEESGKRRRVRL